MMIAAHHAERAPSHAGDGRRTAVRAWRASIRYAAASPARPRADPHDPCRTEPRCLWKGRRIAGWSRNRARAIRFGLAALRRNDRVARLAARVVACASAADRT